MRLLLLLYVIVTLLINFFIESFPVFFLVITTYPIAVYLLLSKPAPKAGKAQELVQVESRSLQS